MDRYIEWGGVRFDEPRQLVKWEPPNRAAVYAIMVRTSDDKYRLVYVGQTENLNDRGFDNHQARKCWVTKAEGHSERLYISCHFMPNSSESERLKVEGDIIAEEDCPCNKTD